MTDFSGRSVLITGGASGIGAETARVFLEKGCKVAIVDLSEANLAATAAELSGLGELITIPADVASESATRDYVQRTREAFGSIDVFFNNAGIEGNQVPLTDLTAEQFQRIFAVNTFGVFLGMKYVLPIMYDQGRGSIINTSSQAGLDGSPNMAAYVGSKHAVTGLTKTAALEAAARGVRVNSIHPYGIATPMVTRVEDELANLGIDPSTFDLATVIPVGRTASAREMANVVVFLASDEAAYLTGLQLRVDGGLGAR